MKVRGWLENLTDYTKVLLYFDKCLFTLEPSMETSHFRGIKYYLCAYERKGKA